MRHLFDLIVRFRRDEGGAFAVIFGVLAIAIVALSGAAVDFTAVEHARTQAQVALDAASLALQPKIYDTDATTTIQAEAQAILLSQVGGAANWTTCDASGNPAPCVLVATPVINQADGQLTLTATVNVPLDFVSLIGVTHISSQIVSEATRKKLSLEVALVLDNSGSMGDAIGYNRVIAGLPTRMDTLHSAADCAVNILFYGVTSCSASTSGATANPNVKIGLVPFNDEVNVGANNANATWIDRTGGSNTFDNDNFDNDDYSATPYTGTTDRINLFNKLSYGGTALSWGGCVEARINNGSTEQYDTDDTTPDTTKPDTMFVPLFAPDEPDTSSIYKNDYISDTPSACNWTGTCAVATTTTTTTTKYTGATVSSVTKRTVTDYRGRRVSGPTTIASSGPTSTTIANNTASTNASNATFTASFGTQQSGVGICSCSSGTTTNSTGTTTSAGPTSVTFTSTTTVTSTSGSNTNTDVTTTTTTATANSTTTPTTATKTCTNQTYTPVGLTDRVLQERLCKYTGSGPGNSAVLKSKPSAASAFGPNVDCPASAIQPLTTAPATVTTAIDAMTPGGNTNIQEGTAWGFRVLSPTAPFTEGNAYDTATSKVMIIMTDGENTYNISSDMNGASLYSAYAYLWDNYKDSSPKVSRGRMGDVGWTEAQVDAQINARLATTCTNAKAAGITIYTIGLATANTSDPTGNKALLTNCATLPADAYFPTTASDLTDAFTSIANQLAALRLAR